MFWEVVAVFLLLKAKHAHSLCTYSWEPLPSLDGRQGQGPLLNVTIPNRLQCSFLCVSHPDCMTFSYEPSSRRCHIHWLPSPTAGDPLAGMKSFRLPRCRKTCLAGWTLHKCAICLRPATSAMAYHAAGLHCRSLGGELQKWRREADFHAYFDFVFSNFASYQDMWIGANDEATEGTFLWDDGTPADIPWNSDVQEPSGGASQDCVFFGMLQYQMSPTYVVFFPTFQDASCTGGRKFVCVYFGAVV